MPVHFGAVRVMVAELEGPYVIVWLVGTSEDGLYLVKTRREPYKLVDSPADDEQNMLWAIALVKASDPVTFKTVTHPFQTPQLFVFPCADANTKPDVTYCISFLGRHGTDKVAVIRVEQAEARLQGADRIGWVPMPASPRRSPSPDSSFPVSMVSKNVTSKGSLERSRSTKASSGETLDRSRSRRRSESTQKNPTVNKVNINSQTAQLRGHAC